MVYKGNESRRWPLEHFLELARLQLASGRALRVFAGPSESIADDERFRALAGEVEVVRLPLRDAARSLSECRAFVGNDSGLAHLAAGLGVPTVALFGMTSPVRATPVGPAHAVRTSGCPPCHDEGSPDFRCVLGLDHACITKDLAVADVARALDAAFSGEQQADAVASQGAYRLYGRAHA
jgi:ADP-heptose:LPS heptosyltransferase